MAMYERNGVVSMQPFGRMTPSSNSNINWMSATHVSFYNPIWGEKERVIEYKGDATINALAIVDSYEEILSEDMELNNYLTNGIYPHLNEIVDMIPLRSGRLADSIMQSLWIDGDDPFYVRIGFSKSSLYPDFIPNAPHTGDVGTVDFEYQATHPLVASRVKRISGKKYTLNDNKAKTFYVEAIKDRLLDIVTDYMVAYFSALMVIRGTVNTTAQGIKSSGDTTYIDEYYDDLYYWSRDTWKD